MKRPDRRPDGTLELVKSSSAAKAWLLWYTAKISEAEHHRTIDGKSILRFADALPAHIEIRKFLRLCMSDQQHNSKIVYSFALTAEEHIGLMQMTERFAPAEQKVPWGHMLASGWRDTKSAEGTHSDAFWKAERARVEKLLADEEEAERKRLANPPKPKPVQKELI